MALGARGAAGVPLVPIRARVQGGARRWQSCGARTANHTERPEGPHKIADGWIEAALTFVHPADKKAFA